VSGSVTDVQQIAARTAVQEIPTDPHPGRRLVVRVPDAVTVPLHGELPPGGRYAGHHHVEGYILRGHEFLDSGANRVRDGQDNRERNERKSDKVPERKHFRYSRIIVGSRNGCLLTLDRYSKHSHRV
jgi:hypothetical protein